MKIQILGTGCMKCDKLAELAETVAVELQVEYELEKIKDLNQIMAFGVMLTPALAVDGVVKISGRLPSAAEMKKLLSE